jgi:hypothetical protein
MSASYLNGCPKELLIEMLMQQNDTDPELVIDCNNLFDKIEIFIAIFTPSQIERAGFAISRDKTGTDPIHKLLQYYKLLCEPTLTRRDMWAGYCNDDFLVSNKDIAFWASVEDKLSQKTSRGKWFRLPVHKYRNLFMTTFKEIIIHRLERRTFTPQATTEIINTLK